jgi:(1->4)-alpha-D-glucan 1-alpha-D-glucosylmutase
LHVLAYVRKLGDQLAIIAVPRLSARLLGARDALPLGADVWSDTRIELPTRLRFKSAPEPAANSDVLQDVLTSEPVHISRDDEGTYLLAADVFSTFPAALLRLPQ